MNARDRANLAALAVRIETTLADQMKQFMHVFRGDLRATLKAIKAATK